MSRTKNDLNLEDRNMIIEANREIAAMADEIKNVRDNPNISPEKQAELLADFQCIVNDKKKLVSMLKARIASRKPGHASPAPTSTSSFTYESADVDIGDTRDDTLGPDLTFIDDINTISDITPAISTIDAPDSEPREEEFNYYAAASKLRELKEEAKKFAAGKTMRYGPSAVPSGDSLAFVKMVDAISKLEEFIDEQTGKASHDECVIRARELDERRLARERRLAGDERAGFVARRNRMMDLQKNIKMERIAAERDEYISRQRSSAEFERRVILENLNQWDMRADPDEMPTTDEIPTTVNRPGYAVSADVVDPSRVTATEKNPRWGTPAAAAAATLAAAATPAAPLYTAKHQADISTSLRNTRISEIAALEAEHAAMPEGTDIERRAKKNFGASIRLKRKRYEL